VPVAIPEQHGVDRPEWGRRYHSREDPPNNNADPVDPPHASVVWPIGNRPTEERTTTRSYCCDGSEDGTLVLSPGGAASTRRRCEKKHASLLLLLLLKWRAR
jgi:hypothetical protein